MFSIYFNYFISLSFFTIEDYDFQNIMFVHNFVSIFLIYVFIFVFSIIIIVGREFSNDNVLSHTIVRSGSNILKDVLNSFYGRFVIFWGLVRTVSFKSNDKNNVVFVTSKYNSINHNMKLELIWTLIPIFIILEMILPSLSLIADDEVDQKSSLYTVGVLGNQWYWNYELNLSIGIIKYVSNLVSESSVTGEELMNLYRLLQTTESLPIIVGVKTSFYITSNDVNHSFALPGLGIKVDAIPGRINLKAVIASRLGLYSGMCSELCGIDHGFMPISVKVLTFSEWWYNVRSFLDDYKLSHVLNIKNIWYIGGNKENPEL